MVDIYYVQWKSCMRDKSKSSFLIALLPYRGVIGQVDVELHHVT